jgi:hypothetical protein
MDYPQGERSHMRMLRSGVTPRIPHVFITLYNRYTHEIILCGCYACGPIPRARANPRDTKRHKTIYVIEHVFNVGNSYLVLSTVYHNNYSYSYTLQLTYFVKRWIWRSTYYVQSAHQTIHFGLCTSLILRFSSNIELQVYSVTCC